MSENIGIMSGAFFVSKTELLRWLNDFFKIGYTKVEEVATGAIHCQILDSIFPGKVPLHKVNFQARHDYEYVNNYKVLQRVFSEQNIAKHVDVEKLIKAKYQDNLEFLQWMKHLWDVRYGGQEYDAVARREEAARLSKSGGGASKLARPAGSTGTIPAAVKKPAAPAAAERKTAAPAPAARKPAPPSAGAGAGAARRPAAAAGAGAGSGESVAQLQEKLNEQGERLAKLKTTVEGLEKERNFYFGKLREIEIICQTNEEEDAPTKAKVLEILYATDDNDEFETPPQDQPAQDADQPAEEPLADDPAPQDDDLISY